LPVSLFLAPLKNNRDIETNKCVFKKSSLQFRGIKFAFLKNQVCALQESSLRFAEINGLRFKESSFIS